MIKPRCAAYARYSSDRQSPASIHDQVRKCREYCEQQGWDYLAEHVYRDEELSGAGADRPGFLKLLDAASRVPRPFDVLLVDDTSRLSRNQGETARVVDRLTFAGIRIVAVSQGIDTQNEQADVLMTVHGLVDSLYIKELAKKTHRGLAGRALLGFHTGGRCYGYDNVAEGGGVRLRINSAVVGEFVLMQQLVFGISRGNVSANDNVSARRLSIPESRSAFLPSAPHDSGTRCNSL